MPEITAALIGGTPQEVLETATGYGDVKARCTEAIVGELDPIRRQHDEYLADPAELRRLLAFGAERASAVAGTTLHACEGSDRDPLIDRSSCASCTAIATCTRFAACNLLSSRDTCAFTVWIVAPIAAGFAGTARREIS